MITGPTTFFFGASPSDWYTSTAYTAAGLRALGSLDDVISWVNRRGLFAVLPHEPEWLPWRPALATEPLTTNALVSERRLPPIQGPLYADTVYAIFDAAEPLP